MTEGAVAWLLISGLAACALGALVAAVPGLRPSGRLAGAHALAGLGSAALAAAAVGALVAGRTLTLASFTLLPEFGRLSFRIDALSAFFVLLIGGLGVAGSLYALGYMTKPPAGASPTLLGSMWNLFLLSMAAVVMAGDALSFLFTWEIMSIVSFLLVIVDHHDVEVRRAGYSYVVMTHIGTAFLFGALLLLFARTGSLDFTALRGLVAALPAGVRNAAFVLACVGFGTKAGIVPLHIWLPQAHPAAPSHVSALMSGAMVKTALYGLLRLGLYVLGGGPAWWGGLLVVLGGGSALLGALYATQQAHLKRLLAYSTVENVGLLFMGFGAALLAIGGGQPVLAGVALAATLFHAISHAAFKGLAFMGAGAVLHGTGTANMERLGGLIRRMPRAAAVTLVAALAMAGLPPLSGFIGEWLSAQSFLNLARAGSGAVRIGAMVAVAAVALAAGLAAAASLKAFGITFLARPRTAAAETAHDAGPLMLLGMGLLAIVVVAFGAVPALVLRLAQPVIALLLPGHQPGLFVSPWALAVRPAEPLGVSARLPAATVPLAIVAGGLLALCVAVLIGRRLPRYRRDLTWTCGIQPDAGMQYSGAGFTKPIMLMFRGVLFPVRTLQVDPSAHPLFPGRVHYRSELRAIIEQRVYRPLIDGVMWLASRLRHAQTGSLQTYLLYLLLAVVGVVIAAH